MSSPVNIFWFRRDLRLDDNTGLYHALQSGLPVQCIFIFDRHILDKLENPADSRVAFIHFFLSKLNRQLKRYGSRLITCYDTPESAWKKIIGQFNVKNVFTNHDYEPYARKRDSIIEKMLAESRIGFHTFKDQVVFEKSEVVKEDGKPYTVFTPYWKKYLQQLKKQPIRFFNSEKLLNALHKTEWEEIIPAGKMGFRTADSSFDDPQLPGHALLKNYAERRDYPSLGGTSRMSAHLRFGTVSIRRLASLAYTQSHRYMNELIWREFYMMILWHFPHVVNAAFKKEFDLIRWRNDEREFEAWCKGMTGYPMVDAGMRELNETGYMHNRLRMITASFLTKHLLVDWRWGEAYFASRLLDYELASNNGGWQWAAGCGVDAAPYFRIFNPYEQEKRFDPERKYINRWIPEIGTDGYPPPIVEHKTARERCLKTFSACLSSKNLLL